jgi:uncharacterized repeat protein (TIGR01451 family)
MKLTKFSLPINKRVFLTCLGVLLGLFLARPVLAEIRCEPQYGGGEVCVRIGALQVNKLVWDPESHAFVDNLGPTHHRFLPGEEILFKIKVKNVGDEVFNKVDVDDTLPPFLRRVGGEELSFDIDDLVPGEEREVEIKAVVVEEKVGLDQCDVNLVEARADGQVVRDTARICVSKKAAEVVVLPKTGPSPSLVWPAFLFVTLLGTVLLLT